MHTKLAAYRFLAKLQNGYSIDKQSVTYLRRFRRYAFTEGKCKTHGQYEASITKMYHSVEKGLAYKQYRAGFGKENIEKLISTLEHYSEQYSTDSFCYRTAISVIEQYICKNRQYGYTDDELEIRFANLPGKDNKCGGTLQIDVCKFKSTYFEFEQFLRSRHSMRVFAKQSVPISKLQEAIKLAQNTPSACNRQAWKTMIVSSKEIAREILDNQNGNRGFGDQIDKLLVVSCDLCYFNRKRELHQAFIDGGMYAMNVLHCLHAMNIASVPLSASLSYSQEKKVRSVLKISDSEMLIMFIGVGAYPEVSVLVPRSERRPVIVEEI